MDISSIIVKLRNSRHLSQEELAKMLFVSRDLVSKWERGVRRPDMRMIERIADIFSVAPETLLDKTELITAELEKCLPAGCDIPEERLTSLLDSFLKSIGVIEADMFIQRYYFLKSASEIAVIFNYKENHVRSTLHRTRKKLKKYITGRIK